MRVLVEVFVPEKRRSAYWLPGLVFGVLVVLAAAWAGADWYIALPPDRQATFVGRQSCVECHQQEHKLWEGSHHDKAMDLATPETVLGNFDNQTFTYNDITSRMFREGDKYFVETDGPDGEMAVFEIKYVFGVEPLQQYMVEFPDGRIQVLGISWDTENKRWFHVYQNDPQPVVAGEWIHWTGGGQNWNYMCAECHSTNLQKNYDLASDTYHTTFSEIDVSCEACHGPGSIHLELANSHSIFWDRNHGYGLAKLKDKDPKAQLDTCAKCHSRRRIVHPDYSPGQNFLDYYMPELLDDDLYHADGQIDEEVYVYGSFLQSLMYRKGVRCTDCHDPHTTKLKAQGNALCVRCHVSAKYDTPLHHRHKVDSKGAQCVECHMPTTTYMVVDPRRDHSIRIPRPDLTVELGTPNACNGCHDDKTPEWAADKVVEWYGPKRRHDPHFAMALACGRTGHLEKGHPLASGSQTEVDKEIRRRLMELGDKKAVAEKDAGPIVRASAVALLGRYPSPESLEYVAEKLKDEDGPVRVAAVRSLETLIPLRITDIRSLDQQAPPQRAVLERSMRELVRLAGPALSDPLRAVRIEAARILTIVPLGLLSTDESDAFDQAFDEFLVSQAAVADQPAAHLNLGAVYGNLGKDDQAEEEYKIALRMQQDFVPARVNLAMLYDQQGRTQESEVLLKEVTQLAPEMADGHYSLGLLLAADGRLAEATKSLGEAVRLAPDHPRMRYNYALALMNQQQWDEAETQLQAAQRLDQHSADIIQALLSLHAQQQHWPQALQYAEILARQYPQDPGLRQQVEFLREKLK